MESSSTYTFALRNAPIIFGILFITTGFLGYFQEDSVEINGKLTSFGISGLIIFEILGFGLIVLWNRIKDMVVHVKLDFEKVSILSDDSNREIKWTDVKSLNRIRFLVPPAYQIKLRDGGTFIFVSNPAYIDFGFGIFDFSRIGKFVKKKKREFNI